MNPAKDRAMQPKVGKEKQQYDERIKLGLAKQTILQYENTFLQSPVWSAIFDYPEEKHTQSPLARESPSIYPGRGGDRVSIFLHISSRGHPFPSGKPMTDA